MPSLLGSFRPRLPEPTPRSLPRLGRSTAWRSRLASCVCGPARGEGPSPSSMGLSGGSCSPPPSSMGPGPGVWSPSCSQGLQASPAPSAAWRLVISPVCGCQAESNPAAAMFCQSLSVSPAAVPSTSILRGAPAASPTTRSVKEMCLAARLSLASSSSCQRHSSAKLCASWPARKPSSQAAASAEFWAHGPGAPWMSRGALHPRAVLPFECCEPEETAELNDPQDDRRAVLCRAAARRRSEPSSTAWEPPLPRRSPLQFGSFAERSRELACRLLASSSSAVNSSSSAGKRNTRIRKCLCGCWLSSRPRWYSSNISCRSLLSQTEMSESGSRSSPGT
mmetsp:Transcript_38013/g.90297  ORF Transcript_38013/g.90297 Transcript_38013/m.90297 type:complete len:336 (+) Transcript_38013:1266-2273(+)